MKYFAYGSNMSLPRLRNRIPGAERVGTVKLEGHALRFHKLSEEDASGKCDALFTGSTNDQVYGALYEISNHEKGVLDEVEGLGYGYLDKIIQVSDTHGNQFEAFTYYAIITDPSILPYSWYLFHVIKGARETGAPESYITAIEAIQCIEDPDRERDAKERAIYA